MSWQHVLGHDAIVEQFRTAIRRGRLASSFLLTGPVGVGKRTFALNLARALLCEHCGIENDPEQPLLACGACPSCVQVTAETHPDLLTVSKPADKSFIPLELLIGSPEKRMREGLCYDIGMKPYLGGRKIAIIDDADYFNIEGANCLLKTLEEPPAKSLLLLIGTTPSKQLPTIRSRCQMIRFQPLQDTMIAEILLRERLVDTPEKAEQIARASDGSMQQALSVIDGHLTTFRPQLFGLLAATPYQAMRTAQAVAAYVDEAGKAASARRQRMHQVLQLAVEFYRVAIQMQSGISGDQLPGGPDLHASVASYRSDVNTTADRLEQCLTTAGQVDRNVHLTTLIECWCDALAG